MRQFPTNADLLLSSSKKLTENTFASGAISFQSLAISLADGKLLYRCHGSRPCSREGDQKTSNSPDTNEKDLGGGDFPDEVVIVRSTQRTVRAIDEYSGTERWNFRLESDLRLLIPNAGFNPFFIFPVFIDLEEVLVVTTCVSKSTNV